MLQSRDIHLTSVIIPAFNEETVIGRTLDSLLSSIGSREAEVVVVCNGCTDNTFEVARRAGPRVQVLETPLQGKCAAINLGEHHVRTFPRIYLDADITVSPSFFVDMERVLEMECALAAWPSVKYDLSQSSWPVAAFYRVWTAIPYNKTCRIGVGAYALSAEGRSRFGRFPDIISDDGFMRGWFGQEERTVVQTCHTCVRAPRNLISLIAVRTRSRMGVYELWRNYPEVMLGHRTKDELTLRDYLGCLSPRVMMAVPIYLAVVVLARILAIRKLVGSRDDIRWRQDPSSRMV